MSEPILDQMYWKERLLRYRNNELHRAIFKCPLETWQKVEAKHKEILAKHISPSDSILDCGCGWGRLLTLMPSTWLGHYIGVDLSPDFVKLGRELYPDRAPRFFVGDLRELGWLNQPIRVRKFSWAILISIRPMVIRNLFQEVWDQMEKQIRSVADKLLYLEYDPGCEGMVE